MGIDFNQTFGAGSNSNQKNSTQGSARQDQPKAKVWVNIGYVSVIETDNGEEDRFVSLPMGIPLDTMAKVDTRSNNELYSQFQAARNGLFDQMMTAAETLKPGEDIILGDKGGLCIQIRRTKDEQSQTAVTSENVFAKQLVLA